MTISSIGLHQFAVSAVAALIASTLFVSAAIGPVVQFV